MASPSLPPALPPEESTNVVLYALGIVLAVISGLLVAYSMNVQRYALIPGQGPQLLFCRRNVRSFFVWCFGLVVYGVGSGGTYSLSGLLIPLSLLSALFVTWLLVSNLWFAKVLLQEEPTLAQKAGAVVVVIGSILCSAGAPTDSPTEFTSEDVARLFSETAGAVWFITLCALVVLSILAMCWFERRFPTEDVATFKRRLATRSRDSDLPDTSDLRLAPAWLESLMALVYPGSLGLDEAIVHVCLRAGNAMSTTCDRGGCQHWIYPVVLATWLFTAVATLGWLRVVFRRYETTVALPVEYGAIAAADVISGLIFVEEHLHMETWQHATVITGIILCLVGIQVGRMGKDDTVKRNQQTSTSATSQSSRQSRVSAAGAPAIVTA
ncbi:hypothetical protein AB1Y20_006148 [Prymnesium parvum]|uniref:Magnesium transporter n=1 Tax=Prymnesium parvum TaxID=97485 RepID=A0AB34J3R4_PRYPA